MHKRIMSWFLSVVMILSVIPVAHAEGADDYKHETNKPITWEQLDSVPEEFKGTTHRITLNFAAWGSYEADVYLPYDYNSDPTKVYNVIVYVSGSSPTYDPNSGFAYSLAGRMILDYAYYYEQAEPFIFISLIYSSRFNNNQTYIFKELMRYVQENYRVYGEKYKPTDEVYNHYALCGFSSGAYVTAGVMIEDTRHQYFGTYGILSIQGTPGAQRMQNAVAMYQNEERKIDLLYMSSGQGDNLEPKARAGAKAVIPAMEPVCSKIYYLNFVSDDFGHGNPNNIRTSMVKFLSLAFKDAINEVDPESMPTVWFSGAPNNDDVWAFAPNTEAVTKSFAEGYGWDADAIRAETWTGQNGETFKRVQGHQAEAFEDMCVYIEEICIELGIITGRSDGGNLSIVEIAKAEAIAYDSMEDPMGSNHVKYNTWYYGSEVSGDSYPWCAAFISWCAWKAGLLEGEENCISPIFTKTAGVQTFFNWFTGDKKCSWSEGREISQLGGSGDKAQLGDIVCFYGPNPANGTTYNHIGIVTEVSDSSITITQGNTGDKVQSLSYGSSSLGDDYVGLAAFIHVEYPASCYTEGREIVLPEGLGSEFLYMGWSTITAVGSTQAKLRDESGENYNKEGFAVINGRYVIACTTTFGKVGDYVDFYQSNGNVFHTVIGDIKNQSDDGCNAWGHKDGNNVIEFIVNSKPNQDVPDWYTPRHVNPGTTTCHPEWGGQTIVKATNLGNYFVNPNIVSEPNEAQQAVVDYAIKALDTQGKCFPTQRWKNGCAAFVSDVYTYAGYSPQRRDAIFFWEDFKDTGAATREMIPIGAVVVGAAKSGGGEKFGHAGIYIGNGEVIHASGGANGPTIYKHSLSRFISWCGGDDAVTKTIRGTTYIGFQGWVWPGVKLGDYADYTGLTDPK